MKFLFVVDRRQQWPFEIPGTGVVSADAYLTDPIYTSGVDAQVVNLCRANKYQGRGYYVSLLGEARGHRPLPDVKCVEDLQGDAYVKLLTPEFDELVRKALQHDTADLFQLDSYFGQDPAGLHAPIAQQLFAIGRAPLMRARFRREGNAWQLENLSAIGISDVPAQHRPALLAAASEFVTGVRQARANTRDARTPRLAILRDPDEVDRPSDDAALAKFMEAAPVVGLAAELIGPGDLERLPEFDGLFIRTTTNVGHWTYEFSRRAESLGLVVIDDPESILKCTNKVFLNELLARHDVPRPPTMIVHAGNLDQVIPTLGLPCVLKQPDSGFGLGVVKIESEEQLAAQARQLLEGSELLVAQGWLPTGFDWRIGIFDRRPLFAAKYFMAPGHWQIIKREDEDRLEGETAAFAVGEVPEVVLQAAWRAANLIGRGFYGVDLKQVGEQCYVIEVNDNPNVDAGNEDQIMGDALYREIMGVFARRIAERMKVAPT